MRLYLSSYRLGDHAEKLVEIAGSGRVAVIGNALDFLPDTARRKYSAEVYNPINEFKALGLDAEGLDLRLYFGQEQALRRRLSDFDMVWLLGGNAFLLMRAIRYSRFDRILHDLIENDDIAYGGFSAGAVVATPDLRGIDLMDPVDQLAEGYRSEVEWTGMNLVNFSIVPHYRSNHPEAESAEKAAAYMRHHQMPHLMMVDGDVYFSSLNGQGLLQKKT